MIKKRKGWLKAYPPLRSPAPQKPQKFYEKETEILVAEANYDVKLMNIDFSEYPLESIYVTVAFDDYDRLKFYSRTKVKEPNAKYAEQLSAWKALHKQWQAGKAAFDQELKEWKLWKLQEEEKERKAQVKWARKVIRENAVPLTAKNKNKKKK
jgi:hypothetical protein